jgi:hypothetical protein
MQLTEKKCVSQKQVAFEELRKVAGLRFLDSMGKIRKTFATTCPEHSPSAPIAVVSPSSCEIPMVVAFTGGHNLEFCGKHAPAPPPVPATATRATPLGRPNLPKA